MECDRDMALINQNARIEVPDEWIAEFAAARAHPTPFNIMKCTQDILCIHGEFLSQFYKSKCPMPTRDIRELIFKKPVPVMYYRMAYSGIISSKVIIADATKQSATRRRRANQRDASLHQTEPQQLYCGSLPIKKAKYDDLQVLSRFCSKNSTLLCCPTSAKPQFRWRCVRLFLGQHWGETMAAV